MLKTSGKFSQIDSQDIFDNYARSLPHYGVSVPFLEGRPHIEGSITNSKLRRHLLSDPRSLLGLLEHGFPHTELQHLSFEVPMHYYATLQEQGYNPRHLAEDVANYGLDENHYRYPYGQNIMIEGGIPSYVAAVKAGASREDIQRVMSSSLKDGSSKWLENNIDKRYRRVQHPLSLLWQTLRGGGTTQELVDEINRCKNTSTPNSSRLSVWSLLRSGGSSREEAEEELKKIKSDDDSWALLDGLKHFKFKTQDLTQVRDNYPGRLKEYVTNRLTKNLGHEQSLSVMNGRGIPGTSSDVPMEIDTGF